MTDRHPFHQWIDLAQPRLGSQVVYATDDFFADKSRLILPEDPVFIEGKYDTHGKWMDGWESRRKRSPGHDYCIVKLGRPGIIHGVDIDTRHFTGNFPPDASIDGCVSETEVPDDGADWYRILETQPLKGDTHHYLNVYNKSAPQIAYSHLRLNIYPDGGVARLRVYGEIRREWSGVSDKELIDLLALENGGRALVCNNEHFGSMHNLNVPGRGVNMGDGWETARRREPGNDWVVLALGCPGTVSRVEIDTAHFKGNYPDRASLHAALYDSLGENAVGVDLELASRTWPILLAESKLAMDQQHTFTSELHDLGPVSHVRLNIFPDGGVSRVRLFGYRAKSG